MTTEERVAKLERRVRLYGLGWVFCALLLLPGFLLGATVFKSGLTVTGGPLTVNHSSYPQLDVKGVGTHGIFKIDTDTPTTKEVGLYLSQNGVLRWELYIVPNTTELHLYGAGGDQLAFDGAGKMTVYTGVVSAHNSGTCSLTGSSNCSITVPAGTHCTCGNITTHGGGGCDVSGTTATCTVSGSVGNTISIVAL